MSINKPGNGETPKKKPSILGKISKRLKDTFSQLTDNKEPWDCFSPEMQEEMLESLEQKDNVDLNSIVRNLIVGGWDVDISGRLWLGDEEKDKIGKYIMINGMKCRKRQPGITGFTYEVYYSKYYPDETYMKIGFCDKGIWKKSIEIKSIEIDL